MSARAVIAISAGEPAPESARALEGLVARVVVAPRVECAAIAALAAAECVLWLPLWSRIGDGARREIEAWLGAAASGPRVALARQEMIVEGGAAVLALREAVLLSTPGAVVLDAIEPRAAAGAARSRLRAAIERRAPDTISEHLLAIDAETSQLARRLAESRVPTTWAGLAREPLAIALRAILRTRGSRRVALPRAVLEGYRRALLTAKLWEARSLGEGAPR